MKVTDIDLSTAGIVPHDIESKHLGPLTVYDLAGHPEFYSSHDAALRSVFSGSPSSVILLIADMSRGIERFRRSIIHWCGFAENLFQCSKDQQPFLIVVGSHSDKISSAEISAYRYAVQTFTSTSTFLSFRFVEFVALDCRYSESRGMIKLCPHLFGCCQVLKQAELISFREQCFLAFLFDKFLQVPAVTISNLLSECSRADASGFKHQAYLPPDPGSIAEICIQLNKRGNILFLFDDDNVENSWIVLQKDVLLNRITGAVFAPKEIEEYLDMATDTGIISSMTLSHHFPDLDLNLIVLFMCQFQFCHEVTDPEILQQLLVDHSVLAQQVLFFPGLVKITVPQGVWELNSKFTHQSVWLLRCRKPDQFLSSRFLHVIVHRLAFSFAMSHSFSNSSVLMSIHRKCSVWKNGIFWRSLSGVDVIVETVEKKEVAVYVRSRKHYELDAVRLRSSVISKVLQAVHEFCPKVLVDEYFVQPDSIQYPIEKSAEVVRMIDLTNSIVSCKPFVYDKLGDVVEIDALLDFEPFARLGEVVLRELFDEDDSDVQEEFIARLADRVHEQTDRYMKVFNTSAISLDNLLNNIPRGETYKPICVLKL